MENKKLWKLLMQNKGFTGVEITVAIVVLTIVISLITVLFFNIYLSYSDSKRNSEATAYATQIMELVQKMYYNEVTNENLAQKVLEMNIPSSYSIQVQVDNYNNGDNTKEDLVKTVKIAVNYQVGQQNKNVSFETIKAKEMLITPNSPKLSAGMVPVKYVVTNRQTNAGYWQITAEDDSAWYSYENKRWANIMLQDGLTVEGGVVVTDENRKELVGKKVETMGSMFVWIPRYAYKIPEENLHTNVAGQIDIVFLYSTSNSYVDTNGNLQDISNLSGYKIHPSFQSGETKKNVAYGITGYENGEWKTELTGYWVAKFEASSSNPDAAYGGGNTDTLYVKSLPSMPTWKNIDVINICKVSKNMTTSQNPYQLDTAVNSHLIKNSEWGAVVYLTQSEYGNMELPDDASSGVWNNNYHNGDGACMTQTGMAGNSRDSLSENGVATTLAYEYNTINGQKASTTRNVYGIYDMAGGAWEFTAAVLDTGTGDYAEYLRTLPVYEWQEYTGTGTTGTTSDRVGNYAANAARYGDAMYETSAQGAGGSDLLAWGNSISFFIYTPYPIIHRGGDAIYEITGTSGAGIFASGAESGKALTVAGFPSGSFRTVLVVE